MQTFNQNSNYIGDPRKQKIVQILQAKSGLVPAEELKGHFTRAELLPFLRKIEKTMIEQEQIRNQLVLVYWSSSDVANLLPQKQELLILSRASLACSAFSEHRQGDGDEFAFIVMSKELSIIVYGQATDSIASSHMYECSISFDPNSIMQVTQTLTPYWEFADAREADKLDRAIKKLGSIQSLANFTNLLKTEWTGIKTAPMKETGIENAPVVQLPSPIVKMEQELITEPELAQSSDLMQRIANDYPYPIANPYRTLQCITEASEKYKEQLRLVENLLALLAGISLSITAQNDPGIVSVLRTSLISGVSVGHWRELIRKCTVAWKESSTKDIPLAKAIIGLRLELVERDFGKAVEQLVRARNDFAHHRGPTAESQIEKETVRLDELLRIAIEQTLFLCDYPMRIVRAIDVMPTGSIKMTCLKASGDHPALRQEVLQLSRGFPKGQMIINAGASNWLPLYPFISQDICPKCGSMEIFLLDKWKFDKNSMQLRSFERGHTQQSSEISDSLKALINQ